MHLKWVIASCCIQIILAWALTGATSFMLWMLGGDEPGSVGEKVLTIATYSLVMIPLAALVGSVCIVLIYNINPELKVYKLTLLPFFPFIFFCVIFFANNKL
ncbi:hypothetical protein [Psychromonas antarctica]|uniref:hypothetical protein n=1 Tax=Psychromonas antarctica TaxID=67573 RepID=UPI001EE98ECB|nr:hypothetical protein [Psychromonas antarctica]MCG6202792.1 hypothetical protein [Psychromonas antarctica]